MAFDQKDIQQLESIFHDFEGAFDRKLDQQRSAIVLDTKTLLQQELRPIRRDLEYIKEQLDKLFKMESEDIQAAYGEIEELKEKVKELEQRITILER